MDLILFDVMMLEMDGYIVFECLCENIVICDILVIFVIVKDLVVDEECGFEFGVVDYIVKLVKLVVVLVWVYI